MDRPLVVLTALVGIAVVQLDARQDAGARFEVVSIKRSAPNQTSGSISTQPGNQFVMVNMEVRALIGSAYPADSPEYVNAPQWTIFEKYDITAKPPEGTSRADMQPMFRALLAERFNFKGHYETREQPMYALVLARTDGKLGPAMEKLGVDCAGRSAARLRGETLADLPPLANGMAPCSMRAGPDGMVSGGMTMERLARSIQGGTGRILVDRTGLTGDYAFTLNYTSNPRPDSDTPSLFTALQEQLGLKLESIRGPVTVLVIDHIDRPTEN
jgi:uncharacterized protein (TIGR03435 family)